MPRIDPVGLEKMGLRYWERRTLAELDIDVGEELPMARMANCTWKTAHKEAACPAFVHQGMRMVKVTAATLGTDMRLAKVVGTAAVVVVGEVEYRLKTHKYVVGYHRLKLVAEVYTAGQVDSTSNLLGQEILSAEETMRKDTYFAADLGRWVGMGT